MFKDLAEFDAQAFRRQARRVREELVEGRALQRADAQFGQDLLLPDALMQGAQRQVRTITLR
ncbi:MAG TPA: hypothetical protein VK281_14875 [Xanthobacteraceae bacterium]|nr:hypothetical protein [Xanthobacteraceae bacterium]